MNVVWISLAVLGAILMVGAVGRFVLNLRPQPEMGGLPTTPLERLGWVGLGITSVVGLGLATLVVFNGATGFHEDPTARAIFAILMLGGVGIWMAAWTIIKRRSGGAVVDERDRAILARSISVESVIVLLSLVAWTVTLTEVYWEAGAVPIGHIQLLFWSTFIGGAFGRSLGIVMGYRREITVDA
jgi:hypothetical protein